MSRTLHRASRRCPAGTHGRAGGLTLIELMTALAILAVLGVLSYRSLSAATAGVQRLSGDFQRWRDVTLFFQTAETDFMQMAALPASLNSQTVASPAYSATSASGGAELSFLKLDGATGDVRRRGYRLVDGQIVLLRWPGVDTLNPPVQDAVLDKVSGWRVSFIDSNGEVQTTWPPNGLTAGTLPAAIDLEVELADLGKIHRVYALH